MIIPGIIASSGKGQNIAFYVYGSGTPSIHGAYIQVADYNGLPQYNSLDGLRMVAYFDGSYRFADLGDYDQTHAYFHDKTTSALNPLDVTVWQTAVGTPPPPILSLTPVPVAMNYNGAGSGNPQPQDVPVIGETNGKPEYFWEDIPNNVSYRMVWTVDGLVNSGKPSWHIKFRESICYWSGEDVTYPSDCTSFNVGPFGSAPTPTITAVY